MKWNEGFNCTPAFHYQQRNQRTRPIEVQVRKDASALLAATRVPYA
jgi:hypothetical protein